MQRKASAVWKGGSRMAREPSSASGISVEHAVFLHDSFLLKTHPEPIRKN